MILLAWLWLRYQLGSELVEWFRAADRHCCHGTQAAHRALALRRNRRSSRRCRDPGRERSRDVAEQELSPATIADGDTGNATVLFFGGIRPPRFRWVASRRGYASCMRQASRRIASGTAITPAAAIARCSCPTSSATLERAALRPWEFCNKRSTAEQ